MKRQSKVKQLKSSGISTATFASKAMLVNLSISYWTGKATDDSVIDELTQSHSTERDVHDYRKRLVKAEAINAVKAVRSKARAYHMYMTSPWIDGGTRVLSSKKYMEYAKKMGELHDEYDAAILNFIKIFPQLVNEAKKRLGTLFNQTDYPTPERLKQKFGWDMHVFPIPAKQDWRVEGLGDKTSVEIQGQIDAKVKEAMSLVSRDLGKRLFEVVKTFVEKMREADPKFRDSIVGNINELVDMIPDMNVAGDPDIEALRQEVAKLTATFSADSLREDTKARKKAADAADELLKKMAGYIGG